MILNNPICRFQWQAITRHRISQELNVYKIETYNGILIGTYARPMLNGVNRITFNWVTLSDSIFIDTKAHNVNLQSYADDSQLYLRCQRQHMTTAGRRLEMCITYVRHWMAANRLKLNADKTQLLWAGPKCGSTLLGNSGPPLRLGDETITASDIVRFS